MHSRSRTIVVLLALVVGLVALEEDAAAFPKCPDSMPRNLVVKTIQHPDFALRAAEQALLRAAAEDRPFLRFFSFLGTPDDRLVHDVTTFSIYVNMVNSFSTYPIVPRPLAETDFRVWFVDIRDFGWTINAFSAVARRDKIFTEPNCDHQLAERVRRLIGIQQDPKTFHVEAVVPAHWFLWTIMNSGDSKTTNYYDLLYAVERFGQDTVAGAARKNDQTGQLDKRVDLTPLAKELPPEPQEPAKRPWPGGNWTGNDDDKGKYFPPGAFQYQPLAEVEQYRRDRAAWEKLKVETVKSVQEKPSFVVPIGDAIKAKIIKDFPEDLKQFQDRWGVTANRQFLDGLKIVVDKGAVVAGSKTDPRRGSYVAYNDRVIRFLGGQFNNLGANMETQDFDRTSGRKNAANLPIETTLGKLDEDAGEDLYTLPNGFQATFIHNAAGQGRRRVDHADSKFVHASLDPRDVTIWDGTSSCVMCHARSYGVLSPTNDKVGEALARGVKLNVFRKDDQIAVAGFFGEKDWLIDGYRAPYKRALQVASKVTPDTPAWNGVQLAEATVNFIDWYHRPLSLPQVAAEIGYPPLVVLIACLHVLGNPDEAQPGNFDTKNLFLNWPMPRTVFEDDAAPELIKVCALLLSTENPDPLLQIFAPELARQAVENAKGKKGKK